MLSRWLLSLALLGGLVWWLGPDQWVGQLSTLQPQWLVVAFIIGVVQVGLSAGRWWLTARSLGLKLSYPQALQEYYLGSLINQVLPGGVVGDVYRAKRHSDVSAESQLAWFAVIIERFSGQLMLVFLSAVVLLASNPWRQVMTSIQIFKPWSQLTVFILFIIALAMIMLVALLVFNQRIQALGRSAYQALIQAFWPWPRGLLQVLSSLLIVLSYVAVMVCATWAVGVDLDWLSAAVLAPPLLLAMVVPITVSGWGLREWMAAGVWMAMGFQAAQGVAVSVAYGVMIFFTALPGMLMWRAQKNIIRIVEH